jgi:hypothetical protein
MYVVYYLSETQNLFSVDKHACLCSMCKYASMHVCVYVGPDGRYVCVCVCVHINVCVHVCMHIGTHVYM